MRILITADYHLTRKRLHYDYGLLDRIFAFLREEVDPDIHVIAGDLLDSPSEARSSLINDFVSLLTKYFSKTYILSGNHDIGAVENIVKTFSVLNSDKVVGVDFDHLFIKECNSVKVALVPWLDCCNYDWIPMADIFITHNSFKGDFGDFIVDYGWDPELWGGIIFDGHIHRAIENNSVVYVGALLNHNFTYEKSIPGAVFVDIIDGNIEWNRVRLPDTMVKKFKTVNLEAISFRDFKSKDQKVLSNLPSIIIGDDVFHEYHVKVRYNGNGSTAKAIMSLSDPEKGIYFYPDNISIDYRPVIDAIVEDNFSIEEYFKEYIKSGKGKYSDEFLDALYKEGIKAIRRLSRED